METSWGRCAYRRGPASWKTPWPSVWSNWHGPSPLGGLVGPLGSTACSVFLCYISLDYDMASLSCLWSQCSQAWTWTSGGQRRWSPSTSGPSPVSDHHSATGYFFSRSRSWWRMLKIVFSDSPWAAAMSQWQAAIVCDGGGNRGDEIQSPAFFWGLRWHMSAVDSLAFTFLMMA